MLLYMYTGSRLIIIDTLQGPLEENHVGAVLHTLHYNSLQDLKDLVYFVGEC